MCSGCSAVHGIFLEPAFSHIIPKLRGTVLAMLLCKGIVLKRGFSCSKTLACFTCKALNAAYLKQNYGLSRGFSLCTRCRCWRTSVRRMRTLRLASRRTRCWRLACLTGCSRVSQRCWHVDAGQSCVSALCGSRLPNLCVRVSVCLQRCTACAISEQRACSRQKRVL